MFLYSSVHTPWLIYSLGYCERCCREDDSTGVLGCADLLSFGEVFQHKGLNSSQGGQVPPLVQGRWGRSCRNVSPWARLRTGGHQRGGQDSVTLEGGKDATGRYHRSPSAQPPFPQLYPWGLLNLNNFISLRTFDREKCWCQNVHQDDDTRPPAVAVVLVFATIHFQLGKKQKHSNLRMFWMKDYNLLIFTKSQLLKVPFIFWVGKCRVPMKQCCSAKMEKHVCERAKPAAR